MVVVVVAGSEVGGYEGGAGARIEITSRRRLGAIGGNINIDRSLGAGATSIRDLDAAANAT